MKKLVNAAFMAAAIGALSMFVNAQVPVQTAPAKIGIVNSDMFSDPTQGITRLNTA
jgi:hypothetical protein